MLGDGDYDISIHVHQAAEAAGGHFISVTRPGPVEDTRPIMSPVSRSGIILNNDTLKQSFHIVSHQEWADLNLASLEIEQLA